VPLKDDGEADTCNEHVNNFSHFHFVLFIKLQHCPSDQIITMKKSLWNYTKAHEAIH